MRVNLSVFKLSCVGLLSIPLMFGCSGDSEEAAKSETNYNELSVEEVEQKAKEEGEVNSVGMPDTWANWVGTWEDLNTKYGLKHTDTDMSSAEELAKFESEKENATADIGDVGVAFGPIAEEKELTLPYKTSYWDEIPEWAKDDNGDWIVGYTGTIAFISDKTKVKEIPKSWKELKESEYSVTISDVPTANQGQFSVLAAAYANGGDEKNIEPGLNYFADLAKEGRIGGGDVSVASLEKGEVEVAIVWDFNALNYRDQIDPERFEVIIPEETSVMSGYATVINKYAKHPHAAMLAREYILSDEGQMNLAEGYARPIREKAELPEEVEAKLLPDEMYKNVRPVEDDKAWEETTKQLPQLWEEKVLVHAK
ncbi:ABC transporter substrate-binding protein [Bacillus sp. FJAT-42315]|uniref:ABC transporter substrate-binding protein n=1 Tax=Bacillus sp. FJAT-42315 TaxID=2014077 RepID=UPI000C2312D7|nr:extracellular solute-binding protein [Bacillus sp. FJAT-42315]